MVMPKLFSLLSLVFVSGAGLGAVWNVDAAHSSAQFRVRHMMVSNVSGELTGFKGTVSLDDKDLTKMKAETTIDVSTLTTHNGDRDKHLKSPDFFDAAKYPSITFKSKKVTKAVGGKLNLTGDLTLHGVTKEVVFEVEGPTSAIKDPWGNTRRGLSATMKINRKDFGISWSKTLEAGGLVVGDEVNVNVEMEMISAEKKS